MTNYTIIILHKWKCIHENVKEIFRDHNLRWNQEKIIKLDNSDLKEILNKFQITKLDFIFNECDIGLSGVWENEDSAIKIVKIENNDDAILIYKGVEKEFYIEFLKKCKDISSLIRKIVDDKVTFEKRTNIELFEKLNNKDEEKKVKIKNFNTKTEIIGGFSDEFKNKWINCIMQQK